jgi:S-(hydroxymethyl)glutathione dehydrogenase/alcohol dehydrogenase
MRAVVLAPEPGFVEVADIFIDTPLSDEVLVRTMAAGLCHSDLHLIDRAIDITRFAGNAVLGHEAAGIVEAVGDAVTSVRPGDHVITFSFQSCGRCSFCARGKPVLCSASPGSRPASAAPRLTRDDDPLFQVGNLGAFAEQMLVHESAIVKIDHDYPFDRAAILGCGVTTGLGAVFNTAAVRAGSSVAVIGVGGVGLSMIQGARIAGASQIIAVDREASKFDLATKLGATDCVDASKDDPVAAVLDLTGGGVDYSFEAIGLKSTIEQSVGMLARGGTSTIVGVAAGEMVQFDATLFLSERHLQGSLMGSTDFRTDLPRFIDLDLAGRLDVGSLIESHLRLDDINTNYDAMRRREINGRRVIMFSDEGLGSR